jgi:hypothetical protein
MRWEMQGEGGIHGGGYADEENHKSLAMRTPEDDEYKSRLTASNAEDSIDAPSTAPASSCNGNGVNNENGHDEPEVLTLPSSLSRARLAIYLLDFNQCRVVTPSDSGVAMCVEAFLLNDPYYPKLVLDSSEAGEGTKDAESSNSLWEVFERAYLGAVEDVCGMGLGLAEVGEEDVRKYAERFLAEVKRVWDGMKREREVRDKVQEPADGAEQ